MSYPYTRTHTHSEITEIITAKIMDKIKMLDPDIIDVVDLSVGTSRDSINEATARDLRALTQNSGLTITPAPFASLANHPSGSSRQHTTNDILSFFLLLLFVYLAPHISFADMESLKDQRPMRRVLRPRTEPKSYAEVPDIVLLPAKINGRQQSGNNGTDFDLDSDDEEMRPIIPIKELSAAEIWERERALRKLREELRSEETKLVVLKKLKQSQMTMKENLIVTPINASIGTASNLPPAPVNPVSLSKGSLSVTPTTVPPLSVHAKTNRVQPPPAMNLMRNIGQSGQQPISLTKSTSNIVNYPRTSLPGGATLTPGGSGQHRSNFPQSRPGSNLTITPSVTITPTSAPPAMVKQRHVSN